MLCQDKFPLHRSLFPFQRSTIKVFRVFFFWLCWKKNLEWDGTHLTKHFYCLLAFFNIRLRALDFRKPYSSSLDSFFVHSLASVTFSTLLYSLKFLLITVYISHHPIPIYNTLNIHISRKSINLLFFHTSSDDFRR